MSSVAAGRAGRRRVPLGISTSVFLLVCATLAAFYGLRAPAAAPADAPADEFSSGRAQEHISGTSLAPHPLGSPANAEVRQYIAGELSSLGLEPQVQTATVVDERFGSPYDAAAVHNVLARIEGTADGDQAVLLAAHHDSVSTGPGANDDGAGVATLLETARALGSGPRLRNDVVLLFTDGEETGLLGADAFVSKHPWAGDVAVALNFEARGTSGPSVMFETSAGNSRLIAEFARAAPRPVVASSGTYEVYNRLPFGSDLVEFKDAGIAGLGFSYFRGATAYHTALDDPDSVDPRSLQHHGSYALALARHLGQADLADLRPGAGDGDGDGDAVYFDVLGLFLVRYPASWALGLAGGGAVGFAGIVTLARRRRLVTVRGTLGSLLASLLTLVAVPALVAVLLPLLRRVGGGRPASVSVGDVYHSGTYSLGLLAAALAVAVAVHGLAAARVGAVNLAVGALLPWTALALVSAVLAPGISFLFTWPLVLALAGLAARSLLPAAPAGARAFRARTAVLLVTGAAAAALFAPSVYLLHLALTVGTAAVTAAFVVLGVGLLAGHIALISAGGHHSARRGPWWIPAGLALTAAGLFTAGGVRSGFDAEHPRPDNIFYALDADTGQAWWATLDEHTDGYTSRFLGPAAAQGTLAAFLPFAPTGLLHPAPALPLAAPVAEVLNDAASGDSRTLSLRLSSPRGAPNLSMWLESDDPQDPDTPVLAAAVNGEPVEQTDNPGWGRWALQYHGMPQNGIELTLQVKADVPVRLRVVEHSAGLPDLPGVDEARPAATMPDSDLPTTTSFADATFVSTTIDLERQAPTVTAGATDPSLPRQADLAWHGFDGQRLRRR